MSTNPFDYNYTPMSLQECLDELSLQGNVVRFAEKKFDGVDCFFVEHEKDRMIFERARTEENGGSLWGVYSSTNPTCFCYMDAVEAWIAFNSGRSQVLQCSQKSLRRE